MVVFMESDHIHHDFWKYMDPDFPGYRPEFDRYQHAIRDTYVALDSIVGEMMAALPANTTALVASDHGSGPLHKVVYIDKYLIQRGLMELNASGVTRLKRWALQLNLPVRAYQIFSRLGIDIRQLVPKKHRTRLINAGLSASDIDWAGTKAYTCGDGGQIAINLKGRERLGCVSPADYETVREEIMAALWELRDPETHELVVDHIYRREEVYQGPYLETAPDILFSMKDYSYVPSRSLGLHSDVLMEPHHFGKSGNSGGHTMDGILIAHGPTIRKGQEIQGAHIFDLAPTALHAMGLPVPEDMDGRVLTQLFTPDYLDRYPVRRQSQNVTADQKPVNEVYSDKESAEIHRRLKDLGYLA
jgi:predicted AlkP superfamily phosphohydrolase/phosphomutase